MADRLLTGTTLVENTSRSNADVPVGGIIQWDDTYSNLPDGFLECDGSTVNDPLSIYNGQTLPNLNTKIKSISAVDLLPLDEEAEINRGSSAANNGGYNTLKSCYVGLSLPDGATITEAKVASGGSGTWELNRRAPPHGSGYNTIATEELGTADESPSSTYATIDNENYAYWFKISPGGGIMLYHIYVKYEELYKYIIRIK